MHAANRYSNQTIPKRMTKQAFLLITNKKSIWVSVRLMIIMIFCCFMEMSFGFRNINLKSFSSKSDMFHYFTYLACATKKKQNFMFWIIRFKSFFFSFFYVYQTTGILNELKNLFINHHVIFPSLYYTSARANVELYWGI